MNTDIHESFLQLVRLGIGHTESTDNTESKGLSGADWVQLKALADRQGLSAVVLDGIDKLNTNGLSVTMKLKWIGEILRNYELRYRAYEKAISSLAGFYNQHGFKMMVLKGYACSLDWPRPEHRPCGDIDIWQFGQQKEADKVLSDTDFTDYTDKGSQSSKSYQNLSRISQSENTIEIDSSHHHHTVFKWNGFMVENHYDFINVHHHNSHIQLEKTLKELGKDDCYYVLLNDEKVYLPSANLHALFLIKHTALHFAGIELTFRQVLDWAFFVEKHGKDVNWNWLLGILDEYGMMPFFNILNAICIEDLGFDATIFPSAQYIPDQKERVLKDILTYQFSEDNSSNVFIRQVRRFRRWKANEWKHKLCYKESMWSAFWSGVWGHLLKPSSI